MPQLTHDTLHVVRSPVLEQQVDKHNRYEQRNGFEVGLLISTSNTRRSAFKTSWTYEEERKVLLQRPCDNNQQGDHARCDLDRASYGNTDSEFHFPMSQPNILNKVHRYRSCILTPCKPSIHSLRAPRHFRPMAIGSTQ